MAFKRQCDKCKENFDPDEVKELRYVKSGVGHYHTIHLCEAKCGKELEDWLRDGDTR